MRSIRDASTAAGGSTPPSVSATTTKLRWLQEWPQRLRHQRWFNAQPCLTAMSVAEHSYMTAVVMFVLAEELRLPLAERYKLLAAALFHDLEEAFTGDVNSLAKEMVPEFRQNWAAVCQAALDRILAPLDAELAGELRAAWGYEPLSRTADLLSMWLYADEERRLGNGTMEQVCQTVSIWLNQQAYLGGPTAAPVNWSEAISKLTEK